MAYQYVGEPLAVEEADPLASACVTSEGKLGVWASSTRAFVSRSSPRPENIAWQSRELHVRGKRGPHGTKAKARAVPMSARARALPEPYFSYKNEWFIGERQAQKVVKKVADRAKVLRDVTPHVLRHTFATLALQKGISMAAVKAIIGHDRLRTTAIHLTACAS